MTQKDTNNGCLDLEAQSLDELGRKMDCGNVGEVIDDAAFMVQPHSSRRREAKNRELLDQPLPAD